MIYLILFIIVIAGICGLASWVVFRRFRRRTVLTRLLFSLLASTVALLAIGVSLIGTFYVLWIEPWPISLRQGPDNSYAHACFERVTGEDLPPTFFGVYCREDWGPFGDSTYSIRFSFDHRSQVDQFVQLMDLRQIDDPGRSGFEYKTGPAWWPTEIEMFALPAAYRYAKHEYETFWVDPAARIAYFQKASW